MPSSKPGTAQKTWAEGMRAVHDQAAGAVMVEVIRPSDMAGLVMEAFAGSVEAAQSLRLSYEFMSKVRRSSLSKPHLCGCCPRSIRRAPFNTVLTIPHNSAAQNALVIGICERCGTEPAELLDRAKQALTRVWPNLRPITVHPEAGRA